MSTAPDIQTNDSAPPELHVAPATPRAPRRRGATWAIAAVVAAVLGFVAYAYLSSRHAVTTDDAQVEGHIVPVVAKVGGYVDAVHVEENQSIHAGDLLVQIDDRELKSRLAQADAQLLSAEAVGGSHGQSGESAARLAIARAGVAQAEAAVRTTTADLERFRKLAVDDVITPQQLDQAEAAATTAQAQLVAAREQVVAAGAGQRAASGQLEAATAARDQAALQLGYASITAPLDGVASRKAVEIGQLVQAGQQIMSIVPLSDIWVVANLKETQLKGVDVGDAVDIRVDGAPSVIRHGRVESISPATGAKFSLLPPDNATGNFTKVVQRVPVRIRFLGANDAAHPLRPGMSVKVTVHTS